MNEKEKLDAAVKKEILNRKKEFDARFYRFGFITFFAGFMMLALFSDYAYENFKEDYRDEYLFAANETCKIHLDSSKYEVTAGIVLCKSADDCRLHCITQIKD